MKPDVRLVENKSSASGRANYYMPVDPDKSSLFDSGKKPFICSA